MRWRGKSRAKAAKKAPIVVAWPDGKLSKEWPEKDENEKMP